LAIIEKIVGKKEDIDIEEFLNTLDENDETIYEDADAFVKPMILATDADKDFVIEEAKKGNLVLANIADLSRRNAIKLRDLVSQIKDAVDEINGDIARISHDKILITPSKVKIIKKRQGA
jgi:SepF-like predicted cell division protein (DUF552 family)